MTALGWLIYSRVSTDEQAEDGASLDMQEQACRRYAEMRGWTVAEVVRDDGYTGRNDKRPGYQKVLRAMRERSAAGVIAWKLKRLTRSVRGWIDLLAGSQLHDFGLAVVVESLDTTTPIGRALATIMATFNQLESEENGVQTSAAMRYLKDQGYWTGGTVPAGCEVVTSEDGKRRKLVPAAHADALRPMWGWMLAGDSLLDIARRLREERVPATMRRGRTTGETWTPTKVRALLLSPQVAGVLVDAETQAKVRAALAVRGTPVRHGVQVVPGKKAMMPSPLAGLLRCPTCGRSMHQVTANGRSKAYRYFRCTLRNKDRCPQTDLKAEPIEAEVLAAVATACQAGGEYQSTLRRSLAQAQEAAEGRRAGQADLRSQREVLTDRIGTMSRQQQEIGTTAWTAAMRSLGAELDQLDRKLADIEGSLAVANVDAAALDYVLAELAKGAARLPELPVAEQAIALQAMVHSVRPMPEGTVLELYEPQTNPPPVAGAVRAQSPKWGPDRHAARIVRVTVARCSAKGLR